jgi:hypothetical protein
MEDIDLGLKQFCNINIQNTEFKSQGSSVGIATDYRLDNWMIRIRFPVGAGNFSLQHHEQSGSGAHPASYPMSTGGSFFPQR